VGVIGLSIVYSFRPPSGFLDGFSMLARGKTHYLNGPYYYVLMGLFGICALFGLLITGKGLITNDKK